MSDQSTVQQPPPQDAEVEKTNLPKTGPDKPQRRLGSFEKKPVRRPVGEDARVA